MANFDTPYYLDNFEKQFRFSEFGDNENYFLRLIYLIRRTEYAKYATPHGAYPALDVNITAHNGKKIFRDAYDVFEGGKSFLLLSESARDRAPNDLPGVIQVEQIYGYAPAVTHTRSEQVDWTQPGIIDNSVTGDWPLQTLGVDFDAINNEFILRMQSAPTGLNVGDRVVLSASMPAIGTYYAMWIETSSQVSVLGISGDIVRIRAVTSTARNQYGTVWTVPPTTAAIKATYTVDISYNVSTAYIIPLGRTRLQRLSISRPPRSMSVGAIVSRSYLLLDYDNMPSQVPAFEILDTEQATATDTATANTTPTAEEYKDMIGVDKIRPRSDSMGQVLGPLWFYDTYWITAQ